MDSCFIKNGKICLRGIREEDREKFLFWHNDSSMREKIGGIFPFSENTFYSICHSYDKSELSDIWFAVCDGNRLIGITGLHNVKYVARNAELAILIGEERDRRQGKGRIVLELIEKYAFGTLNLHRLYAHVYDDNVYASNFLRMCDWKCEGVMEDASFWNYRFRNVEIWGRLNTSHLHQNSLGE